MSRSKVRVALIAGQQKARQCRRQHHRITHRDIDRRTAELGCTPGDRHHSRSASEFRNVKADLSRAVCCHRDDAGIERERLLRRRAALQLRSGRIAAGPELAARPLHAVDQLSVKVSDFRRHTTLTEIVVVGRGRLVVGEIEDADVNRGNDDLGVFAGA